MNEAPSSVHATDQVGRLPERIVRRPISEAAFAALAEPLRANGAWLSLWDREANCLDRDEAGSRFWTTLWAGGGALPSMLRQIASTELAQAGKPPGSGPATLHPLASGSDLAAISAPIRYGRRATGCVIACVRRTPPLGEDFARLCNQCGVDAKAAAAMAGEIRPIGEAEFASLRAWLGLAARNAGEIESAHDERVSLTHDLEHTYESLNLVYRMSARMSVVDRPAKALGGIARELHEISRAAGVAFVLSENEAADTGEPMLARPGISLPDRIVQAGEGAPTLYELDRLAESLMDRGESHAPHLLFNQVESESSLTWAQPWLKHLLAIPLRHDRGLLGLLLAMNCKDSGDFTSIDVQLFRAVADRVTPFLENQRLYEDLADLLMGLLHSLINSIDAKDPYTCGHSERVAYISRALARASGLPEEQCDRVYLAGLLHDVGKIGVPDAILCKPGKLTVEEFDTLKQHPEIGARILARVRQIQDLIPGVLYHHERMDGRGYPAGLDARTVPPLGRIICLADCFDAMTTNRTYRVAMPLAAAIAEIRRCAGTQFDPRLAETFLGMDLPKLLTEARAFGGADDAESHLQQIEAAITPAVCQPLDKGMTRRPSTEDVP